MMTLAEFRASRRECDDLGAELNDCRWEGEPPAQGFVYAGGLYIEKVLSHWPEATRKQGKYHLIIGRCEWTGDDLPALEAILYEFGEDEQLFEEPQQRRV